MVAVLSPTRGFFCVTAAGAPPPPPEALASACLLLRRVQRSVYEEASAL